MSQSAIDELTVRQGEMHIRTGEAESEMRWADVIDMGDVSAQQPTSGGLEFDVLDYGGRLHIPMNLRMLLSEGNTLGRNQCSIIHLAAGIEWHLRKRPNRCQLKEIVANLAAELRIREYTRSAAMWKHHSSRTAGKAMEGEISKAICHDSITANHGRGFRFRPLFSGKEVGDRELGIRIAELNTQDSRTRVYNYQTKEEVAGNNAIYLMAHR